MENVEIMRSSLVDFFSPLIQCMIISDRYVYLALSFHKLQLSVGKGLLYFLFSRLIVYFSALGESGKEFDARKVDAVGIFTHAQSVLNRVSKMANLFQKRLFLLFSRSKHVQNRCSDLSEFTSKQYSYPVFLAPLYIRMTPVLTGLFGNWSM